MGASAAVPEVSGHVAVATVCSLFLPVKEDLAGLALGLGILAVAGVVGLPGGARVGDITKARVARTTSVAKSYRAIGVAEGPLQQQSSPVACRR